MRSTILFFPILACCFSLLAWFFPDFFVPMKPAIVPLLGVVMFTMGMTLQFSDFSRALKKPFIVLFALLLQFSLMPLIAFLLAKGFALPLELLAGLVLVGACPGGTASNVICYLARADVALSITITALSTLLAVFMTPLLTWLYVGQMIDVPVQDMLFNILRIIVLPVIGGVLLNRFLGHYFVSIKQFFPLLSMLAISLIIAIIVALNAGALASLALPVLAAVILHNSLGLALAYLLCRCFGLSEAICKTLAIEVGMQNSGLAVALALKYFPAAAALPGAVFSIWHNISGALLATYWAGKQKQQGEIIVS